MTSLRELPELGVGIVYWPELFETVYLARQRIDVLEIEPQAFWLHDSSDSGYVLDRRAFDHLGELPQPKIVHGVGFPVGGTIRTTTAELDTFMESVRELDAVWASEHLSFNRVRNGSRLCDLGFLLPPLQSPAGVSTCVANITQVQEALPVPFAVETGVNYLRAQPGELTDGHFFASVADAADCGLLLDVHNLWTNQRNGRQPVLDTVAELPLDRVIEMHLAGGQEFDGYWVDAHSGLVPQDVMDLARQIVPRLPNLKAIIYEVMPEYVKDRGITAADLREQLEQLHELWAIRGRHVSRLLSPVSHHGLRTPPPSLSPADWEHAVGAALGHLPRGDEKPSLDLLSDPGIAVLRRLIAGVRAGKVASTLTLSTRLLLLSLGEGGTQRLFEEFWAAEPTHAAASDEAVSFANFVTSHPISTRIDGLVDVMQFELAAHQAVLTGSPQQVVLSSDPETLLTSLREGRLPSIAQRGRFDVTITPPLSMEGKSHEEGTSRSAAREFPSAADRRSLAEE